MTPLNLFASCRHNLSVYSFALKEDQSSLQNSLTATLSGRYLKKICIMKYANYIVGTKLAHKHKSEYEITGEF